MCKNHLFKEFEPINTVDWHEAIAKFLKGKPVETLQWKIEDQLIANPLHRAEDTVGELLLVNPKSDNSWNIEELIVVKDCKSANKLALEALEKGANALHFRLTTNLSVKDLNLLLKDILLELVHIHFDIQAIDGQKFYKNLATIDTIEKLKGSIGLVGDAEKAVAILDEKMILSNTIRPITIIIKNDSVEALSQAIFESSQWIDKLLAKGIAKEKLIKLFRFDIVITEQYFVEIARIRAFKRLWLALLEAYEFDTADYPFISAITTLSPQENKDEYWNMITATTQAMSAAIAGVDSIVVLPSNGVELANDFSRRIARNLHHLLMSEGFLNRVVDPAAGTYYIENLTQNISRIAWQKFCAL